MKGVVRFLSKRHLMSKRNLSSLMAADRVGEELQVPVAAERSPNEKTVALFFQLINRHRIQEIATQCFAPNGTIAFQNMSTAIGEFCTEMESIVMSFPNFDISFTTIAEKSFGIVVVEDGVATGTHTGAAYGFGPFPPVAKSHRTVRNDPERYEFHLDENQRITHCRVCCRDEGALSGPAGFYEQVGGFPCL